ncbi:MAG: c-type cytochrome biogenesis protein CcsB [Acidobacteriia bacterium]|nr:c-type cytochrome biogenesis protein CcsB [Terriglobia bacterium]
MSRAVARIEQHPASSNNGLLIGVALGMAFLTFMAFLSVVKQGNLFNESNLLYLALIFYGGASALYIGFGVTGVERYVKFASLATAIGFAANTLAAGHRWYIAGRPPFANIYEMLLSFVWTVAALTLLAERKYKVKVIGTVTMPLAVTGVILMQLLPSAVHPLVPALQSTWLQVHVTLAMLAYAACALSFALAMMFLIQDQMKTETFLATTSGIVTAIYLGIMTRFEKWGGLVVSAWDAQNKEEIFIQKGVRLMVTIPDLGWIFLLVLLASVVPLAIYAMAKWRKRENFLTVANRAVFISIALQVIALGGFILRTRGAAYASLDADGLFPTALAASPFILSGLITAIFASLLYLMLYWRRAGLERLLPSADALDRITYKTIGIAFPLLTAMIAVGAYWANQTWGSYWSWDPKETWAAITWLVYAGYLHMRITRGWRGRRAAYFAILGFAVVMFTFFGVTYLLPGLHAYA